VPPATRIGPHAIATLLPDLDSQPGPRYRALSSALAALLLDGRLGAGVRLPSERDLARQLHISRATTTAAYDDLAAQGLLNRRPGSGSFLDLPTQVRVSGPGSRMARGALGADSLDLSRACLAAPAGMLEAAMVAALPLIGRYALGDGYHPYGIDELRDAVADRYLRRGVPTTRDNILITNGAQHGFDLVLRAEINPGDRVLTELPSYPGALEAIKAHHARAVAVPLGADGGWDTAAIANALQQTSPRLAYLIPDFHNPTGFLVGTEARLRVAAAAQRSGTQLVIDESFVDVDLRDQTEANEVPIPMAATGSPVFSLGSMSKPIWGGLRIGWIRAEVEEIQRLAVVRARGDMSGAVIEQLLAVQLLADLDSNSQQRQIVLRRQRDALLDALASWLPSWRTTKPAGGLSAWIELDAPVATPLTHLLEQRGVLISPGSRFATDATLERFLRIPFALAVPDLIRAVDIIAETWTGLDTTRLPRRDSSLVTA
jgi:DNA-binding transcriptional MocR family regulator